MNEDEKVGVAIGIITRGPVDIKWMMRMDEFRHHIPGGLFWKYFVVEGTDGYANNRNKVVEEVKKEGFKYLLFIDDDVFIPEDTLTRMLASKKDIVSGIYWTKNDQQSPVIFEKEGAGPMYEFPVGELFEIQSSGLGCVLINMEVFDAFDKAGIPYFRENWVMELDNGKKIHCPIGEDHYFYHKSRKLGYKVWADGGILCDHYNTTTKRFYPTPDVVRKVVQPMLTEEEKKMDNPYKRGVNNNGR